MTWDAQEPRPPLRRGPRPLLLHLILASMPSPLSPAALLNWKHAWQCWKPGDDLPSFAGLVAPDAHLVPHPDHELIAGIAAYRRHPYRRALDEPPTIWCEGPTRVLDYGGYGPTVLFVPSLVNRAYVLDLAADASFLRFLAGNGVRPLLLDWGWPGAEERRYTLGDYVAGRLGRAIDALPEPVILAGYCMGGLFALAGALRHREKIRGLALLATPWDFHAANADVALRMEWLLETLEPLMRVMGTLPIDAIQSLFAMIDPHAVTSKYRKFAALDPRSARAHRFVAIEDWLNDGIPLAAPVAREIFRGWYVENATARGRWMIDGRPVDPAALDRPTLVAIPMRDRLVPPASAAALLRHVRNPSVLRPPAGHIGMIAGVTAPESLWHPFAGWVRSL